MKPLLAAAAVAVGLVAGSGSAEPQFVPLQQYLAQPGVTNDPVAAGYVAERCAAFYAVFAKRLEGETAPARQQARTQALATAERFLDIATNSMMYGTTIDFLSALDRTKTTVLAIGRLYSDRMERARNLTGDMFSDPLIAGDLTVCALLRN
jgi:hypothetical protein